MFFWNKFTILRFRYIVGHYILLWSSHIQWYDFSCVLNKLFSSYLSTFISHIFIMLNFEGHEHDIQGAFSCEFANFYGSYGTAMQYIFFSTVWGLNDFLLSKFLGHWIGGKTDHWRLRHDTKSCNTSSPSIHFLNNLANNTWSWIHLWKVDQSRKL